jgi:uncharacterized protein YegP (UPF0339 family)
MYFQLYKDAWSQWRWRLRASNHKIVADSAESYITKADAQRGIELVKSAWNAPVLEN